MNDAYHVAYFACAVHNGRPTFHFVASLSEASTRLRLDPNTHDTMHYTLMLEPAGRQTLFSWSLLFTG